VYFGVKKRITLAVAGGAVNSCITCGFCFNQPVVSSRQLAENFGKRHDVVLRSIEEIISPQNCGVTQMFYETSYQAGTGKNYKEYLMNRDGFTLLAMGFTGKKALEWKLKYIQAFNAMEEQLKQSFALPQNMPEALRMLAAEIEQLFR